MSNHLSNERSPYLLQHAENPVDWYPWGEAAFEKARREDKPVFLSIGYATCHWCHVMAEESFADERVAEILNRSFVSVKVDREERPDVDAVYLQVCTALSGSAGWPMTLVLTPEQRPFFAATYLPRESRGRQPGLIPLLLAIEQKWRRDRSSLLKTGEELTDYLRRASAAPAGGEPGQELLDRAAGQLAESYDAEYGGFGAAPKFPTPQKLLFLLRYAALSGDKKARQMAEHSLQQMARGGIFDHFGGGFARYSTDREWLAPHFEKTLYDNALLALAYTEAWQEGRMALYRQTAEKTLNYCLRELRSPEGGFYSGQDADSDGEEGKFYLFTPAEVKNLLGEDAGRHFCECYDITEEGNFHGKSIPNLLLNDRWRMLPEGYGEYRERLRQYREGRWGLCTDTKLLTGWNGLLLAALARAGRVFDRADFAEAARSLARFLLETAGCERPESLCAVCYEGEGPRLPAQLDDYVFPALGLIELYEAEYDPALLAATQGLAEQVLLHFADEKGGFFRTSDRAEALILRPKEVYDSALPSGNGAAARLFDLLWRLTGQARWGEAAEAQLRFLAGYGEQAPAGLVSGLSALMSRVYPTRELVCVAEGPTPLLKSVTARYAPELTVLLKRPGDTRLSELAPFTADLAQKDGKPTFYPCQGGACGLPFTENLEE